MKKTKEIELVANKKKKRTKLLLRERQRSRERDKGMGKQHACRVDSNKKCNEECVDR